MTRFPIYAALMAIYCTLSGVVTCSAYDLITVYLKDVDSRAPIQDATIKLEFTNPSEFVPMSYDYGTSCYRAPREDKFLNRVAKISVKFPTRKFQNEDQPKYVFDPDEEKSLQVNRDYASCELFAVSYPEFFAGKQIKRARQLLEVRKYEEALVFVDLAIKGTNHVSFYQMKGRVLQKVLAANPSNSGIAKADEFVEGTQWMDWGDSEGMERFTVLYQIGLAVFEAKSKLDSVNLIAIKALDAARSLRPSDPRPYQAKYHILATKGTRQGYEDAAQVIGNFFSINPAVTNDRTVVAFVNDWLANIEAAAKDVPPSQIATFNELAQVFRQYETMLKAGLSRQRYQFASTFLESKIENE